jgi:hypothetical protein
VKYRKLSTDHVDRDGTFVRGGDMRFGAGRSDMWIDVPEAVGQAVTTRLRLQQGEWFLDLSEGTPWKTRVLGKRTEDTRDAVIKLRTRQTTGVTDIAAYFSDLNRDTRQYTVQVTINTVYGQTVVEGPL